MRAGSIRRAAMAVALAWPLGAIANDAETAANAAGEAPAEVAEIGVDDASPVEDTGDLTDEVAVADDMEVAEDMAAEDMAADDEMAGNDVSDAADEMAATDESDAYGSGDDVAVDADAGKPAVPLGEVGYDEQGRSGRIHIVVTGDTLWDISEAYLGTPWVWPAIWTDNDDIANPHLILPDDRIWITPYEMRRVSEAEAARLLAGAPLEDLPPADLDAEEASLDLMDTREAVTVRVSSLETTGLITAEQLEAAASIVDAVPTRVMLSEGDQVYVGYGEGDVSPGDGFTVFRTRDRVFDPETGRLLGYHVDILGWVEIDTVNEETSVATVRMSASEMEVGDRIIPREPPMTEVEVGPSPDGVEGVISFFPSDRVLMGTIDYVYLNRGQLDGLEVGSPLVVYRRGWEAKETARNERVDVPDRVIAQLLVVRARPETAVAMVTHTDTELELGDHFRGSGE